MTTMTVSENALMAVRLTEALEKAGIKYYGKIDPGRINPEKYQNLSPKEMVDLYCKENNVGPINVFLDILKEIYRCHRKGDNFPMYRKLRDKKIDFFQFTFGMKYLKMIDQTGNGSSTRYIWLSDSTPLYSEAEKLYYYIEKMKAYQLDWNAKNFIERNVSMGFEKLNEQLNPENDGEKYYQVHRYFCYARAKINKKIEIHKEVFEQEVSRDQMIHQEDINNKENTEEDSPSLIFILQKRIKYQEDIIQMKDDHIHLQDAYIKKLEKLLAK